MLKVERVSKAVADYMSKGVPYGGNCDDAWIVQCFEAFDDWRYWFEGSIGLCLNDGEERRIRRMVRSLKPDQGLVIRWEIETDESGAMLVDRIVSPFYECTDGKYYAEARVFSRRFVVVPHERLMRFDAFEYADAEYHFALTDDAPELGEHIGQCKVEHPVVHRIVTEQQLAEIMKGLSGHAMSNMC